MIRAPWSSAYRMVGIAARMRVSSAIWPSLIGTLKSTRMKTRLPAMSTSLIVFLFISDRLSNTMLALTAGDLKSLIEAFLLFLKILGVDLRVDLDRIEFDIHHPLDIDG